MPVICNLNATTGAVYSQFTETAHKLDCFSEIFFSNCSLQQSSKQLFNRVQLVIARGIFVTERRSGSSFSGRKPEQYSGTFLWYRYNTTPLQ
jgi:hypothetical protein